MACVLHPRARAARNTMMDGRRYFKEQERRLNIEDLPPDEVRDRPVEKLERGSEDSRVGGRLVHHDLKRLSAEETARRQVRSEVFLTQPVKHFPAEESAAVPPPHPRKT
jgi:hypothetical protein